MTKPPYAVPSMAEIASLPWNGLSAISTFSGCGGSSLGYKMAGFKVLWANEFVEAARDTYAANAPETILDDRDIREVSPQSILDALGMDRGALDLLDGSPPCASFSTAGKRSRDWGKTKAYSETVQRTDDLFFEFIRILDGLQPRAFVAENVAGLVKGVAKGYFIEILKAMKACGYNVKAKVLDAKWLGVPQSRQRVIFIGVREDLEAEPQHPNPLPYFYAIRDALPWINAITHDTNSYHFEVEAEADITRYAIGAEWEKLLPGEQSERYFSLVRTLPDQPSPAILARGGYGGVATVTHPTEPRKFSIAELRRLCAFPDDFTLTGSYSQQWERLGRAVPPVMMAHVARSVAESLHLSSDKRGH